MVDKIRIAPWPDFAGNEIAEGDFLVHPNGKNGFVMFDQSGAYEGINCWRLVYEGGISLWLGTQVGPKGKAVRPGANNMHTEKFDDRRNSWSFFPRGGSVNLKEFEPPAESIRGMVNEELRKLIDSGGREALIRLGWTPPEEPRKEPPEAPLRPYIWGFDPGGAEWYSSFKSLEDWRAAMRRAEKAGVLTACSRPTGQKP